MKKVSVITLGCKVNQYESESIVQKLTELGYETTIKLEPADVYIINSCAVTNEAEHKSREQIAKILKLNPFAQIFVSGCSSELHPASFLDKPNVKAIVGTENKLKLVDAIVNNLKGNLTQPQAKKYLDTYKAGCSKTRGYIKIQDGCNNFCSYCVIPYTRGRERSRPLKSIESEMRRLSKLTKEIVLVGINIAGFGKDLKDTSLIDVAKLFGKFPSTRFRFSSWEIGTITEGLLEELQKHENFCPFFHMSLQSASDSVLEKMNRHYTFSEYLDNIRLIRKFFKNASISTDIIVGFPTETEEDFNICLENVKKAKFSNIHVFPFSPRVGTVAATMKPINGSIVKTRAKLMGEVAKQEKLNYINSNLGTTEQVLIEEEKHGLLAGFTKNYIKVYLPKTPCASINEVYKVKILAPYLDGAKGEILNG